MRKLSLAITTALMLLVASSASLVTASASATTRHPVPPGPHAGAKFRVNTPSTGTYPPRSASTVSVACDGQFDVVTSPNGTGHNVLEGVEAVSANDVWAVGSQTNANLDRTLAEHWNGTSWTVVPTINPGAGHNDLFGVSAISSNNVWAVGAYETNHSTGATSTVAEHWNGTSWSKVATVNPSTYSYLFAVTAVNSNSVWAVGAYYNFGVGAYNTLVEHFNGTSWAVIPSPNTGASDSWNEFFGVSAFSDADIWAVGSITPSAITQPIVSLAEHWNGSSWVVTASSNIGVAADNEIIAVVALEAGHAVGVGYGNFENGVSPRSGEAWDLTLGSGSVQFENGPGAGDNALLGVDRSGGSVWAVGYWRSTTVSPRQTLVIPATWDSAAHSLTWGPVGTSASPGTINNALSAVAAISPDVFWAAGYMHSGTYDQTLLELYCALHFNLSAPATAIAGTPFAVTVTVQNANNSTDAGYRGTVHFTSSDSLAVLPADYAFTSGDAGAHTFTGVILKNPYNQPSTITVSDVAAPMITGSASITVACPGVCQAPAATPGSRDVLPGPTSSPSPRAANQSTGGTPGPRTPWGLVFPLGLFAFALSAHRRGRSKERSNVQDKP